MYMVWTSTDAKVRKNTAGHYDYVIIIQNSLSFINNLFSGSALTRFVRANRFPDSTKLGDKFPASFMQKKLVISLFHMTVDVCWSYENTEEK